jgi:hypothetical protein
MKFRKKPVVIEAIQFTHDSAQEVAEFMGMPLWQKIPQGMISIDFVRSLGGVMKAVPGDWIIKGVEGEFYPCKPDIFEATYEAVE